MARVQKATRKPKAAVVSVAKRRGRPPGPPRTTLARWLTARNITAVKFSEMLSDAAPRCGVAATEAPNVKSLLDALSGRHCPSATTMLLVRHATSGDVDLEHWVRDMH